MQLNTQDPAFARDYYEAIEGNDDENVLSDADDRSKSSNRKDSVPVIVG